MNIIVHISIPTFYKFENWTFEYGKSQMHPPWPVNKDLEPKKRAGRGFYKMLNRFLSLTKHEQDEFML